MKRKSKILITSATLLTLVTSVIAFNGFFGGGGKIPEDTFTRGLVAYWSFDEGSGNTAYDASGNGNHGTLINGPKWTQGKIGGALSFDGVDDYVRVENAPSLNYFDTGLTVEAWGMQTRYTGGLDSWLLDKDCTGYRIWGVDRLTFGIRTPTQDWIFVGNVIPDLNKWYHVVGVVDNVNLKVYIYINGQLNDTKSLPEKYNFANYNLPLMLGRHNIVNNFWPGLIDEVRIYNRALSPEEIRFHYSRGGPVAYWKFDEGQGTKVYDLSGNNNNGTLNLGTSGNTDPSKAWVPGKFGTALSFDGVDDYVSVPHSASLTPTTAITLSAWVYYIGSVDDYAQIVGKAAMNRRFLIRRTDRAVLFQLTIGGTTKNLSSATKVPFNTWTYIVCTYDSSVGKMLIYFNGVKDPNELSVTGTIDSETAPLVIGAYAATIYRLQGLIDEVRIYNYARTPDEIRLDYNAGYAARFGPSTDCNSDPGSCMTKGLVAYWSFDEGSGNIAYDSSGNGNHGTIYGAKWTNGKIGQAMQFDGVDDYVRIPETESTNVKRITIAFWFYNRGFNLPNPSWSGDLGIVGGDLDYMLGTQHYNVNGVGKAKPKGWVYIGGWQGVEGPDYLEINRWYYEALVYDGSRLRLYLDGKEVNSVPLSGDIATASYGILIGCRNVLGNCYGAGSWFNGLIDEVRIYNRALSEEEIRYHYNHTLPKGALSPLAMKEDPSLVGYWSFNEGKGTIIYDQSGKNNNGTLYLGSSGNTDPSKAWSPGISGTALSFDGVDDYVEVPDSPDFDAQSVTVTAWVYAFSGAFGTPTSRRSSGVVCKKYRYASPRDAQFSIQGSWGNDGYGPNKGGYYGRALFQIWSGSYSYVIGDNELTPTNKWIFLAGVADSVAGEIRFYRDGILRNSYAIPGMNLVYNNAPLYIGTDGWGTYFPGLIDEVRIYNRALSEQEILEHYRNSKYYLASHFGPKTNCREDPGSCIDYGLVGYWSFDEGAGTTAYDASGKGNNGTLVNGPKWTNGKIGSALGFDGVDDKVQVPVSSSLTNFTQKSVVFWLKPNTYPNIWEPYDHGYWVSPYGDLFQNLGTSLFYFLKNTAGTVVSLGYGIPSSLQYQWIMVATSWDGSTVKLYVNAQLVNSRSFSGTLACSAYPLTLGSRRNGEYPFNGLIDEVRIYNRALSEEEIRYLYNRGAPIAHWKFDEGKGNIAYDSSGNANNGTIYGAQWVPGKFGSALSFDGVDDYVEVPTFSYTSGASITFEAWARFYFNPNYVDSDIVGFNSNLGMYIYVPNKTSPPIKLTAWISGQSGYWMTTININAGEWHHYAMTFEPASRRLILYLDGVKIATYDTSSVSNPPSLSNLKIGHFQNGWFNGLIDDVRIYNYARTPEQILQDYNAGLSTHFK